MAPYSPSLHPIHSLPLYVAKDLPAFQISYINQGFGLAGLGAAMRLGQQGLRRGTELLKRRLLVDIEITRHDESYPWVLNWMTRQYQEQLSSSQTRCVLAGRSRR